MSNQLSKYPIVFIIAMSLVALAGLARTFSQSSRGILVRPVPPADHRIAYGKDPHQFGELRLPNSPGPHPVAVIIHGGCWMAEYGLSYMGHLSASLTKVGVATWNIEYRRIGNEGGGWPGTFQDVAQGTLYLRDLAKTYPLDLNRVVVLGHSAGGHLALWLAAQKQLQLRGVLPMAAITDLRRKGTACDGSVERLLGGAPNDPASPIELLPIRLRQTLIQGETDKIVPPEMAKVYADRAKQQGDDIKLVVIEKAGHFELVDPESFAWPRVRDEVLEMLK
jgi:acetyl esterase/lipase